LRDHKKKEREAVKQGKKPFFLKKGMYARFNSLVFHVFMRSLKAC